MPLDRPGGRSTSRHRNRARTGAALLATAITLTGCTSTANGDTAEATADTTTTVERTAALIPAAPGEPDPGEEFSTRPSDYPATAEDNGIGSIIESQRMAEFLVLPAEVDPALTEEYLDLTRPIFGPIPLAYLLAETDSTIEQIGGETGIIAGFSTARFTKDSRARIVHAVLRFRDAAGAGDAATRLHEHLLDPAVSGPTAAPHPLATMPDSLVHTVETEYSRSVAADPARALPDLHLRRQSHRPGELGRRRARARVGVAAADDRPLPRYLPE
ncbi:DUF7373 family lipoprotein [Rhodococcus sp. B50]|uniref:DUF7373 family lipoprotein n=1 Tax=Rhodococcus sp. B50 TaxID=2682847 RepID=UPI001BD4F596|nr:hypothetical protein [Rhodococcus sp. B50]MBS9371069.1 hypothetical protein [Rhodococcus sp. B50]